MQVSLSSEPGHYPGKSERKAKSTRDEIRARVHQNIEITKRPLYLTLGYKCHSLILH